MPDNGFIDFDVAARNQPEGFIAAGEKFRIHPITIEDMNAYWDTSRTGLTNQELTTAYIELIEKFLYEEDLARWRKLIARKDNPISTGMLMAIYETLLERQTARPTGPLSPSPPGRAATQAGSGGGSRSQVVLPGA